MKWTCVPLAAWSLLLPEPPSGPSSPETPALPTRGAHLVLGARDPEEGHRDGALGACRLPVRGRARPLTGTIYLTPHLTTSPTRSHWGCGAGRPGVGQLLGGNVEMEAVGDNSGVRQPGAV